MARLNRANGPVTADHTSPGLPPVGELVQITYRDVNPWRPEDAAPVRTALGYVNAHGRWCTVFEGDLTSLQEVTAWCLVLVLPESEALDEAAVEAVYAEVREAPEYTFRGLALAVLTALREAAIR